MAENQCKICNGTLSKVFTSIVLQKHQVGYWRCQDCYFVQTDQPYWLNEAYQSAINNNDTGIIARNERFRKIVAPLLFFLFDKEGKYLDYAGGYGIFTRMMRDIGFDYFWIDEYAKNLVSIGFEHKHNMKYNALTAFEVFEHLDAPHQKLADMLKHSETIIFSTELLPDKIPDKTWWYWAFSHGQHIAFYHKKSLQHLAKAYNLNLVSNGSNFHILSRKKIHPFTFRLIYKFSKYGAFAFTRMNMKSKTFNDHKLMS